MVNCNVHANRAFTALLNISSAVMQYFTHIQTDTLTLFDMQIFFYYFKYIFMSTGNCRLISVQHYIYEVAVSKVNRYG